MVKHNGKYGNLLYEQFLTYKQVMGVLTASLSINYCPSSVLGHHPPASPSKYYIKYKTV